jgi:hypothetical protein
VPYPTFLEKYGSRSATGLAVETTFGTPVTANAFLPMLSNTLEEDPGWFAPALMQGVRDKQIYNLYGEAKFNGAVAGPIFPSNAMELMVCSIGPDAAVGYGVTGTYAAPTSTTLNGTLTAGATSLTVASPTGFAIGQQVTVDVGALQEVRKISNVAGSVITMADALFYPHATGVAITTQATTTLNGVVTAPTTTVTVTSAAGIVTGSFVQIDVNSVSGTTTSEVRKVTNVATNTLTLDAAATYNHASGAQVLLVTTPYTHTVTEGITLPSLTVEKNIGSFQSLQFAGCRVNKFELKAPVGNSPVEISADLMGQSVAVLNSPTAISVANELPYVFSEAALMVYGTSRTDVTNSSVTIENGIKETYTYSGQHGPSFLTPVTLHTTGSIDVVFDSLNDATYGDFNRMANGTLGQYLFSLVHPASGGTITIFQPQIVLSKFANDLKVDDVVMSTMTYEASRPLTGNTQFTILATITNGQYLPY